MIIPLPSLLFTNMCLLCNILCCSFQNIWKLNILFKCTQPYTSETGSCVLQERTEPQAQLLTAREINHKIAKNLP